MAIIVLGIGAVMVLAGAGEIYYGSGFIEIERGWSAFIAGTILLTGGLLVAAVALALRSLAEVKTVLLQLGSAGGPVALPGRAAPDIAIPAREPPVALRPAEANVALAGAPALQIEPHFGIADPIGGEDAPPLRLREASEAALPPATPAPLAPVAPAQVETAADVEREPTYAVDVAPDAPPPTPPAAPVAEPVATPQQPPQGTDHADREDRARREAARVEAEQRQEAEPAMAAAPAQSAVIGRYEADGTSYVMFADGSIEAQSEAGIYRFASMAELKAFIET